MSYAGNQPPPIFRRGPAPLVRLFLLVSLCLVMLVADLRFRYLEVLRQGLSVVTYPLQMAASAPVDFLRNASRYFATLLEVQVDNARLRARQLEVGERLLRFELLEQENARLRALLGMAERLQVKTLAAEILYNVPDAFSSKVILDRGARHGVEPGLVVLDAEGVIGQVTRVYPVQSEVTLLSDRNQAVAVVVERSGVRGVLFGTGQGGLEMRFLLADADVQAGDRIVTSGLDGVLVPGLPVATVSEVDREGEAFARILCEPLGGVETSLQVLVIGREQAGPPLPEPDEQVAPPPPAPPKGRR
ncbi:MAG: rod shape-determining protein MreC [Thauera phenolivorans]|uniref:Cell shape-determining protein MreC n=1 Tax=Thauera phenolivorans TaxID=1792543 RepID=A0A7X7LUR8_9RHOO|nr:rod shape-determining protein MreC [Thauera phenolivorans]NLF53226.1 rod shape-determining protein MreC [Thauera phenolivorans]